MIRTIVICSPYVVCALTFGLFLCSVKIGTRLRAVSLMALLLCAAKFTCFEAFGGDPFAPELPSALIWVWNWAYSGLFILFFLSIAGNVVRSVVQRIWKVDCPRLLWLTLLPLVAWGAAAWGCANGARLPEVEELELSFTDLPESLDGYRILQITDIHASASATRERTAAIVDRANAAGADLICLTGDYVDGLAKHQYKNVAPLRDLHAPDGVLAITGNHEYYFDTLNWMMRYAAMTNITFLSNTCAFPRAELAVAGVRDPTGCDRGGFPAPDPDAAFASATNGEFRILLQHRPFVDYAYLGVDELVEKVDLQLSGHTHGGIAPGLAILVALHNKGYVRGVYHTDDGRTMYVSPGAGQWAGFPMRFFNDPKITVFTLRRKSE